MVLHAYDTESRNIGDREMQIGDQRQSYQSAAEGKTCGEFNKSNGEHTADDDNDLP